MRPPRSNASPPVSRPGEVGVTRAGPPSPGRARRALARDRSGAGGASSRRWRARAPRRARARAWPPPASRPTEGRALRRRPSTRSPGSTPSRARRARRRPGRDGRGGAPRGRRRLAGVLEADPQERADDGEAVALDARLAVTGLGGGHEGQADLRHAVAGVRHDRVGQRGSLAAPVPLDRRVGGRRRCARRAGGDREGATWGPSSSRHQDSDDGRASPVGGVRAGRGRRRIHWRAHVAPVDSLSSDSSDSRGAAPGE